MRILTTLICLALPAPVLAQACPTAADLSKGIKFTVNQTDTETFTFGQNGLIQSIYAGPDFESRVQLVKGLYLIEVVDLQNGQPLPDTMTSYKFSVANDGLPTPTSGQIWNSNVTVVNDGAPTSETQTYTFGEPALLSIGACSYDMIPVRIVYNGDEQAADELHFLPDLGISYMTRFIDGDSVDNYVYHKIEVVQ